MSDAAFHRPVSPALFADAEIPHFVTRNDVLQEIGRELSMRRMLYPQWITGGRMSADAANQQMARLEAARQLIEDLDVSATVRITPP